MGLMADTVISEGGDVIGVIPEFMMDKEVAHNGLTKLIVTDSMHQRKYEMARLADAFAVLPGGLGTLDEMAEILTWNQLSIIKKPIGLLNVNNYYNALLSMLDDMMNAAFLQKEGRKLLKDYYTVNDLVDGLSSFQPTGKSVWDKIRKG
jgi:hypothetical protein